MVVSKSKLLKLIKTKPDCFVQEIKAKKYKNIYGDTYSYINENFLGRNFSEKCYKFIYNVDKNYCKICNDITTFRSFFSGYKVYCSTSCSYRDNNRTNKIKNTKLKRYGDMNYNNKTKYAVTMNDRYGISHNLMGEYGNRKCDHTKIENHGSLSYNNIRKHKQTCYDRYKVENYAKTDDFRLSQSEKIRDSNYQKKMRDGVFSKYGVYSVMHVPKIAERAQSGNWHEYELPSGMIIKLQGYEPRALDILLKTYNESDIKWKKSEVPEIWYIVNNIKRRYYTDFYIQTDNLVVEVKSKYTLNANKDVNKLKFQAAKSEGYNFKLMVL
ncbi:hypothetical protein H8D04_01075 [bacterium]|nr:hypothetical protein [bacterium]